jgi:hypothetical protein
MRENGRPDGGILTYSYFASSLGKRRHLATEIGALPPAKSPKKSPPILSLSRFNYGQPGRGNAL